MKNFAKNSYAIFTVERTYVLGNYYFLYNKRHLLDIQQGIFYVTIAPMQFLKGF